MAKKPVIILNTDGKTLEETIEEAKAAFRKYKAAAATPKKK